MDIFLSQHVKVCLSLRLFGSKFLSNVILKIEIIESVQGEISLQPYYIVDVKVKKGAFLGQYFQCKKL